MSFRNDLAINEADSDTDDPYETMLDVLSSHHHAYASFNASVETGDYKEVCKALDRSPEVINHKKFKDGILGKLNFFFATPDTMTNNHLNILKLLLKLGANPNLLCLEGDFGEVRPFHGLILTRFLQTLWFDAAIALTEAGAVTLPQDAVTAHGVVSGRLRDGADWLSNPFELQHEVTEIVKFLHLLDRCTQPLEAKEMRRAIETWNFEFKYLDSSISINFCAIYDECFAPIFIALASSLSNMPRPLHLLIADYLNGNVLFDLKPLETDAYKNACSAIELARQKSEQDSTASINEFAAKIKASAEQRAKSSEAKNDAANPFRLVSIALGVASSFSAAANALQDFGFFQPADAPAMQQEDPYVPLVRGPSPNPSVDEVD